MANASPNASAPCPPGWQPEGDGRVPWLADNGSWLEPGCDIRSDVANALWVCVLVVDVPGVLLSVFLMLLSIKHGALPLSQNSLFNKRKDLAELHMALRVGISTFILSASIMSMASLHLLGLGHGLHSQYVCRDLPVTVSTAFVSSFVLQPVMEWLSFITLMRLYTSVALPSVKSSMARTSRITETDVLRLGRRMLFVRIAVFFLSVGLSFCMLGCAAPGVSLNAVSTYYALLATGGMSFTCLAFTILFGLIVVPFVLRLRASFDDAGLSPGSVRSRSNSGNTTSHASRGSVELEPPATPSGTPVLMPKDARARVQHLLRLIYLFLVVASTASIVPVVVAQLPSFASGVLATYLVPLLMLTVQVLMTMIASFFATTLRRKIKRQRLALHPHEHPRAAPRGIDKLQGQVPVHADSLAVSTVQAGGGSEAAQAQVLHPGSIAPGSTFLGTFVDGSFVSEAEAAED